MFCNQCGNKLPDDAKVCDKCGAKTINWKEEEVCCEEIITEEKIEKPKKKGMWLLWCVLAVIAVVIAYFALNICISHEWQDATCVAPRTCIKCERTEGEVLGHKWQDANCITAKKCSVCGETEGDALGHTFVDATCTEAKRCTVCNSYEGIPNGHDWKNATCTQPKTCNICGKTEGSATKHKVDSNGMCTVCGASVGIEITEANYTEFFNLQYEWDQMDAVGGPFLYKNSMGYFHTGCRVTITPKKAGTYENVEFKLKLHLEDRYGEDGYFEDGDTYETVEINEYGNGYVEIFILANKADPSDNLAYLAPDMKLQLVSLKGVYKQ